MPPTAVPEPDRQASIVLAEFARIAGSPQFCKAEQMVRLLRFVVEETLAGRGSTLKEYTLGVSVFERRAGYEPKADPVVRLEMRRLRLKLAEYYQTQPAPGSPVIEIPKGSYVPVFHVDAAPAAEPRLMPQPRRTTLRPWAMWATAILTVLLAATLFVLGRSSASFGSFFEPSGKSIRRSVAVVGVQELAGKPESRWLGTAIAEMLNSELQLGLRLRAAPQDEVARMVREMGGSVTPRSAAQRQQIRRNLAVDIIVTGSYAVAGGQLRLDLEALDTGTGEVLSAVSEAGDQARLFDLVGRAGTRMRSELGVAVPDGLPGADNRVARRFPAAPGAMELYAKALDRLRNMDAPAARDLLQQAAAADPSNPLVLADLAGAWTTLGYDTRARKAAEQALSLAGNLPPSDRKEMEAKCRAVLHQWNAAIEIYGELLRDYPDDIESGLMLVGVQSKADKIQDAMRTLAALRRLPPQLSADPRLDLAEARIAAAIPDFPRIAKLAGSAAEKAKLRGARFAYARARLLQSGALQSMASANFRKYRQEARTVCTELGDKACVAASLRIEGNYLVFAGTIPQAHATFLESLRIAREIGSVGEEIQDLNGITYCAREQGDLNAAGESAREALRLARETEQQANTMNMLMGLAEVARDGGDLAEAATLNREAYALGREIGNVEGWAEALAGLAEVSERRGNIDEAVKQYEEAEHAMRQTDSAGGIADILAARARLQMDHGQLDAAEKSLVEVRTLRAKGGEAFSVADTSLSFARLALAKSRPIEAESLARQAETTFRSGEHACSQAEAIITLARALVEQKRYREAAEEAAGAAAVAAHTQVGHILAEANLIRERALVLAGHEPQNDELRQVQRQAANADDARLTTEARVLSVEVAALHRRN